MPRSEWRLFPGGDQELYTAEVYAVVHYQYGTKKFEWYAAPSPHDYEFRIIGYSATLEEAVRCAEVAALLVKSVADELKKDRCADV